MYSKQEASAIRQSFWTSFGKYMKPVHGADGETVNWLNYKTGVKHLYFRMDADKASAIIAIEITDNELRIETFQQLMALKTMLESSTGEEWSWQQEVIDANGNIKSRIYKEITGVNIFNQADWPAIISFLKPRILALDAFWSDVKYAFQ